MSVTPFPDPRTTNFIPEAWQWIDLWKKFRNFIVSYPTAQNGTVRFAGPVYLTTRTALTQWADTAYATAQISAWVTANVTPILGTAQVWAILQYYFGGIAVDTINPLTTGGTLLIGHSNTTNQVSIHSKEGRSTVLRLGDGNTSTGGIHINNGVNTTGNVNILDGTGSTGILTLGSSTSTINLNTALEPIYGTPVFTSSQIGYIVPTVLVNSTLPVATSTIIRSVTVPATGVYAFYGAYKASTVGPPYPGSGSFYGIFMSLSSTFSTGTIFQKNGQQPATTNVLFSTTFFITGSLNADQTFYFGGRVNVILPITSEFIVLRIA